MFLLGMYLDVELLGLNAWTLQVNDKLFSKVVVLIYTPTSNVITLIHIPFKLDMSDFLTFINSCKMVSLYGFHLHFSNVSLLYFLFCEMPVWIFCAVFY